MKVSGTLIDGARRLLGAGIDSARLDAELLLGRVLDISRERLILAADRTLSPDQSDQYEALLLRRLNREPVAYITGQQEFWSLDFCVSGDVLVPRPETELLVEIALNFLADSKTSEVARILDLGTGSGAIAVALATELPHAKIVATDISPAALAMARRNAARTHVSDTIKFCQGDLFNALDQEVENGFDVILANPPYVRSGDISQLEREVSRWEPRASLDGGADGLDFYRRIVEGGPGHLRSGGALIVEIGDDMASAVLGLIKDGADYLDPRVHRDYSGRDRLVIARTRRGPELD